jgi:16S rRNA (cytosine967-C5)-methyltransferase
MKRRLTMARPNPHRPALASARTRTSPGLAARRAALQILLRVERDDAFADVLLGRRLHEFAPADRRLITQLVLGTIAWRGRLDYELSRYCSRPLEKLAPPLITALRMGLFQVRFLDRIPPHAAVDTTVSLARELCETRLAGFVNAVLRNAIRAPVSPPRRAADETEYLAVVYSHPRWLVQKLVAWFGSSAESLMAANNQPAANSLRLNLSRGTVNDLIPLLARDGMEIASFGRVAETVILSGAPVMDGSAWECGSFQPQAEASQLVSRLLAPSKGALVIDCASAPGGKTTHIAELIGPYGKVLALDLKLSGLTAIRSTAARLGHRNILTTCADTSLALPIRPGSASFVLLDAPCTGLGTLRQHPEIRWRLAEADFERMARSQRRMLEQAANAVAPGGVLVYAVCSIAPPEGAELIEAFLADNADFEKDRVPSDELKALIDADGYMKTRPDVDGLDGFFAARLKRRT